MSLDPDALLGLACCDDFERAARELIPRTAFEYMRAGAGSERTLHENLRAWDRWVFDKRVLVDVSTVDTSTRVLGEDMPVPLLLAPSVAHRMAHPEGELASAAAARSVGAGMVVSTLGSIPLEDIADTGVRPRWFQLYIHRSRDLTRELTERAHAAGYEALVLTVDTPLFGVRHADVRNEFQLPQGVSLANLAGRSFPSAPGESGLTAFARAEMDTSITWPDLEWFREVARLPIVLKGITTAEDARRAVECGVDAVIVSNHGGRQLDGDPATADVLADVVDAVDGACDVLVDGGIRHGSQILTACALGADAVLIGRPVYWGLACGGADGLTRLLERLLGDLRNQMQVAGVPSLADTDRSLVRRAEAPTR